jgi:hypothetical protein
MLHVQFVCYILSRYGMYVINLSSMYLSAMGRSCFLFM